MNWFTDFFVQNFVLLFISVAIIVHALYSFTSHPKLSVYSLLVVLCTFLLAVSHTLENYFKSTLEPTLTLIFSIIGYTLRPTCVYLFILLTINTKKKTLIFFTALPLLINLLIYCLSFYDPLKEYIVYFDVVNGEMSFHGGYLRFTSHVISLGYMLWLMYISLSMLRFKRLSRGVITLVCSLAVIGAAVIESFFNSDNNIYVLNTVISMCTLFYYLFLVIENTELDENTGLYNKEKYYKDIDLYDRRISGVGLFKLIIPANIVKEDLIDYSATQLIKCINHNMIVYRYEEIEFLLLTKGDKEELMRIVDKYKSKMQKLGYRFIFSYAFKEKEKEPIHMLVNQIEKSHDMINVTPY